MKQVEQYCVYGFNDFKLKISGSCSRDREKISYLRQKSPAARIRLDANNLWERPDEVRNYLKNLNQSLFALEEPLQAMDYKGIRELADSEKVILDESFLKAGDFSQLRGLDERVLINLRISKMGGLLRSIEVAEDALSLGFKLIVGAHVGESSLLSRAAIAISNHYEDIIEAREGAFGKLLLSEDIVDKPIQFGAGGRLETGSL